LLQAGGELRVAAGAGGGARGGGETQPDRRQRGQAVQLGLQGRAVQGLQLGPQPGRIALGRAALDTQAAGQAGQCTGQGLVGVVEEQPPAFARQGLTPARVDGLQRTVTLQLGAVAQQLMRRGAGLRRSA